MKPVKNSFSFDFPMSLQEEFAGVAARAVVDDRRERRDIESLRERMSEGEMQAPCRACRDIEGLFGSLLNQSFGGNL
jgi:hypothetical protein